jgi:UDP-N-acetyl-D-mannosaminuronic acid dehydrogenase
MHLPGAGVGGHCIPKDPWLLIANLPAGIEAQLIPAARTVNDRMPHHVAELAANALRDAGVEIAQAQIVVLGYAYIENSDDARNSPSAALVGKLRTMGAQVAIHDPHVPGYGGDLQTLASGADAVILMVAHNIYRGLDLAALRRVVSHPILVDGRNAFSSADARIAGWRYRGLGRG